MSEFPTPTPGEAFRPSLNQELGIPNNNDFVVQRSDGTQETGWGITGTVRNLGEDFDRVRVIKRDPQNPDAFLEKLVTTDRLRSWQLPLEEEVGGGEDLIGGVPGFIAPEAPTRDESGQPSGEERFVRGTGFMGDPRRVIGHSSNPNNEAMQALADELNRGDPPS
ncbi:MAG: hypothetical protein AAB459_04275 [Patescibacteria group bacterium]